MPYMNHRCARGTASRSHLRAAPREAIADTACTIWTSLNPLERQLFDQTMLAGVKRITGYLDAPRKDGNKYQGVITILLDKQGRVNGIAFKKRSGNDALDEAFYNAVISAGYLELPADPDARRAMVTFPLSLTYDESDMAD